MMAGTISDGSPSPTNVYDDEINAPTPLVVSINVVLCSITVAGNVMVIAAFFKDSKIRQTVAFTLILNLSITDLLVGVFIFPINSYWWIKDEWTLGIIPCKLWLVLDYSVLMMSTFIIVYISLDRYWLLTKGLDYQSFQTSRRVIVTLSILWVITLLMYLFIAFVVPVILNMPFENVSNCELEVVKETWFNVFEMVVQFILPFSALVFLNFKVYSNIRRRSRGLVSVKYEVSTSDGGGTTCHKENGTSTDGSREKNDLEQYAYTNESLAIEIKDKDQVSSNSVSFTSIENEQHSLTHDHEANGENADIMTVTKTVSYSEDTKYGLQLTNGEDDAKGKGGKGATPIERARRKSSVRREKVEFRRHRKAAITLAALVSVFFVCWLPYYVCAIIGSFCDGCISERMWEFVSYFQWCNSTINPFIYGLTNVLFRRNFVKFLHITKCCDERHLEVGSSNN